MAPHAVIFHSHRHVALGLPETMSAIEHNRERIPREHSESEGLTCSTRKEKCAVRPIESWRGVSTGEGVSPSGSATVPYDLFVLWPDRVLRRLSATMVHFVGAGERVCATRLARASAAICAEWMGFAHS